MDYALIFKLAEKETEGLLRLKKQLIASSQSDFYTDLCLILISDKIKNGYKDYDHLLQIISTALEINPNHPEAEANKTILEGYKSNTNPEKALKETFTSSYLKILGLQKQQNKRNLHSLVQF